MRSGLVRYAGGGRHRAREPKVYILLMHAWGMGGTIRTILNLAGYLAERHEVEILSMIRREDEPFFAFPEGVTVTAIDDQRPHARTSALERLSRRHLSERRSTLMNRADGASSATSLHTDVMLARALHTRTEGVLISTRPALNMLAAQVAPRSLVRIGQEHLNLSIHGRRMRRAIVANYPGLDALVVLTDRDRDKYAEALPDGPPVTAIANATPDLGAVRSDGTRRRVIGAGRLTRQKRFAHLIGAFAQVVAVHPDWQLVIYGDGQRQRYLEKVIAGHGLGANVTLPGRVRDMGAAMADASVFALSSSSEGFPMVLLEAMSVGVPVVSYDCPTGPREIIENGRNGLLVPNGNVNALAAAIMQMIEDDELRRRCAHGGLETVKRYSLEAIGAQWEELIERLSGERGASAKAVG